MSNETKSDITSNEDDRVRILVQLAALKERFIALENQVSRFVTTVAEWNSTYQASALKVQDLESRVKLLETKNSDRNGREWDMVKVLAPHLLTWLIFGLYAYMKSKGG